MVMPIAWNESMSTGVVEIDNQHKELFRQIDLLTDAMKRGQGRDVVGPMLDFLAGYARRHFATEERYMNVMRCPVAEQNKQAHREFVARFEDLLRRFQASGTTSSMVLEINSFLIDWLVGHINCIDTKLNQCAAPV